MTDGTNMTDRRKHDWNLNLIFQDTYIEQLSQFLQSFILSIYENVSFSIGVEFEYIYYKGQLLFSLKSFICHFMDFPHNLTLKLGEAVLCCFLCFEIEISCNLPVESFFLWICTSIIFQKLLRSSFVWVCVSCIKGFNGTLETITVLCMGWSIKF